MTSEAIETRAWPRRRWFVAIMIVMAIQTLLIYLVENRSPALPRKTNSTTDIRWLEHVSLSQYAISDPTLFVFPHRNGFSGQAWLNRVYTPDFSLPVWTEAPRLLALSPDTLGTSFREFVAANTAPALPAIKTTTPSLDAPQLFPLETPPAKSQVRLQGALSNRRLLEAVELPSWTNTDLLTNSVVQVLVNSQGNVVSSGLRQSCGLKAADDWAMKLARAARFESLENQTLRVTVGTMIFEWQTVPPVTNNVPTIQ